MMLLGNIWSELIEKGYLKVGEDYGCLLGALSDLGLDGIMEKISSEAQRLFPHSEMRKGKFFSHGFIVYSWKSPANFGNGLVSVIDYLVQ